MLYVMLYIHGYALGGSNHPFMVFFTRLLTAIQIRVTGQANFRTRIDLRGDCRNVVAVMLVLLLRDFL
jgi:hypothetical protein